MKKELRSIVSEHIKINSQMKAVKEAKRDLRSLQRRRNENVSPCQRATIAMLNHDVKARL